MTLAQINSFLDTTVFTVANHEFSIAELMLIPIIVITGIWLTRKIASIITNKLIQRGTNADSGIRVLVWCSCDWCRFWSSKHHQ